MFARPILPAFEPIRNNRHYVRGDAKAVRAAMARWIEHITEPTKLKLVWQAPDEKNFRTRLPVGEITRENNEYVLRYHQGTPKS
jgi:hypothetical protein